MLSENELLERFVQNNIPLTGRRVVENIRKNPPSRRVGGGKLNVVCRFASRKMGHVIQAESHKNELPMVYLWEHDPGTDEFYDQPPQIKLSYQSASGRLVSHLTVPDFFLIQKNWMGWVECKTEEELLKREATGNELFVRQPNGEWRCPAGEVYAAEYGLGFKVCSSKQINWIFIRNINFLSDYLDTSCSEVSTDQQKRVRHLFKDVRWLSLQDIITKPEIDADAVYKMVADGTLYVDLENELLTEPLYTMVCIDDTSYVAYLG